VPRTEPPPRQELDMARSLMDAMSTVFRLEEQHDDYRSKSSPPALRA
jgi:non-homologous end joining protein Ku